MALKGYPRWILPAIGTACAVLLVSGLLLIPTMLVMRLEWELAWRLPVSWRLVSVVTHAAGGSFLLIAVGSLWTVHMRSGWARGLQRKSGGGLSVLFLMLAVTAVAIAYAGEARIGTAASLLHLVFAAASTVLFSWHWWQGVRLKRPPSRSHPAGPGV
jgi:hypothetical protein